MVYPAQACPKEMSQISRESATIELTAILNGSYSVSREGSYFGRWGVDGADAPGVAEFVGRGVGTENDMTSSLLRGHSPLITGRNYCPI